MFEVSWLSFLFIGLLLSQVIILLVTVYFHRACSHKSIKLSSKTNKVCRFLAWFLISMDPQEFAAVHRKHHAKCDTGEDPHSPVNHGWYGVLFGGLPLYRKEAKNKETIEKYGRGLPKDSWEKFYRNHEFLGIILFAILLTSLMGFKGLLLWSILMAWIPFWAAGVVNGLGHYLGYRNYQTEDQSTNLFPFGLWIGGEELHNNHHAFPTSAKFSVKPWELDLGWYAIKLGEKFKLLTIREENKKIYLKKEQKISSLIKNRYLWLNEFHMSIPDSVKPLLKKYGFKNWRSFSKFTHKYRNFKNLNYSNEYKIISKILKEQPLLLKLYKLENELKSFWIKRNYLSYDRIEKWKQEAYLLGIPKINNFANKLPVATC